MIPPSRTILLKDYYQKSLQSVLIQVVPPKPIIEQITKNQQVGPVPDMQQFIRRVVTRTNTFYSNAFPRSYLMVWQFHKYSK